jgi:hypothetical protein
MGYRDHLPQLDRGMFLTDGGLETCLNFYDGLRAAGLRGLPPRGGRGGQGDARSSRRSRANASMKSHAELDEAAELDAGDPDDLAARSVALGDRLPSLNVLGGCCGPTTGMPPSAARPAARALCGSARPARASAPGRGCWRRRPSTATGVTHRGSNNLGVGVDSRTPGPQGTSQGVGVARACQLPRRRRQLGGPQRAGFGELVGI